MGTSQKLEQSGSDQDSLLISYQCTQVIDNENNYVNSLSTVKLAVSQTHGSLVFNLARLYTALKKQNLLALVAVSYFRINAATVALLVSVFFFSKLLTQSDVIMCINELLSTVCSEYIHIASRKYSIIVCSKIIIIICYH